MTKLQQLRAQMTAHAIDAYIIPRADEYLGEFVAPYAERLHYLTDFTGSAGTAVITAQQAFVFSDGRYTLQLEQQLSPADFEAANSVKYPLKDWLYDHIEEGQVIGFDPTLHSIAQIETLEKRLSAKDIPLRPISENLIDAIWQDQPERPNNPPIPFPDHLAGQSSADKIQATCAHLAEQGADAAILTLPDSINWLLNIRGTDIDYTPIKQTYAYIDVETQDVTLLSSQAQTRGIPSSVKDKSAIALDFLHTPYALKTNSAINIKDPTIPLKARKNQAEQTAIRNAHIQDGVAMVKFLSWLNTAAGRGTLTELSIAERLEQFRAQNPAYKGPSFPTIAGFGPNGAVIHYRASAQTNRDITGNGLLLLDSGGQYLSDSLAGTTDITRTTQIGEVAPEICHQNTLVLKGHIALAMSKFPAGTTGAQIDTAARQALWNAGLDYAHGTGHGVGCYLAVHEEAASISPRGKAALEEGMLLSNEPGYYEDGSHGIRIENLVLVQKAGICQATGADMLKFETVTLAPIDKTLIDVPLLTVEEKVWLNTYHARVYSTLEPLLDKQNQDWLKIATSPI